MPVYRVSSLNERFGWRRLTQVLHTASLHSTRVSRWAFRIRLVAILLCDLAIITRIGVDYHAQHSQLFCSLHLQAAEDSSIFGDCNLALQVYTSFDELLVVVVRAVVDEHILSSHISACRVSVEDRHAVVEARGWVIFEHILLQSCFKIYLASLEQS